MGAYIFTFLDGGFSLSRIIGDLSLITLLILVAVCIFVLSYGADKMIDGIVSLALRTGIPTIVIGATVISIGTTMPEAFVSVMAAYMGNPGLALGNGVGSIIADTGLIFGLTCLLATPSVNLFILNRTGWVQIGSAVLLVALSTFALFAAPPNQTPQLDRWVGFFFLFLLVCYLFITYRWALQSNARSLQSDPKTHTQEDHQSVTSGLGIIWLMILGGLILVVLSARILVPVASEIAIRVGVPEDVIAATLVAFGTSLPELITAISAVRKGYPEITVGNIVGADVLNVLFVIGAAAATAPLEIPLNFFLFHFPAMLTILILFRIFISTNRSGKFQRWNGGCLLGVYGVYIFTQYAFNIGALH